MPKIAIKCSPSSGEEGLTYQAAMALLEESQAVIVDHRGFYPRMDVGAGGGGGKTERVRALKQMSPEQQKPTSWADLIRENIQRFRLF